MISVVAMLFVSSRLLRFITDPILHLQEIASRVATQEDYSLRAIPCGDDEVGALVSSFNQMLGRIQECDIVLQKTSGQLELRVQDWKSRGGDASEE
jgi:methyl-accepting chemotaxis protein